MFRRMVSLVTVCTLFALLFWGAKSGSAPPPAAPPATPPPAEKEKKEAPAPRAEVPKAASSRVVMVTVYPTSALITREVDVPEGNGTTEVVVTPLPVTTVQSSLYAEGTDSIRVLSTRFRTRPIFEDTREDVRKLQDELKKLQ